MYIASSFDQDAGALYNMPINTETHTQTAASNPGSLKLRGALKGANEDGDWRKALRDNGASTYIAAIDRQDGQ